MNCAIPIKTEPTFEYTEVDDDIVSDLEDSCEPTTHPGLLCRLCASEIGDMVETGEIVYIFSSAAKDQDIAHKINMSLPVTVKSTDPLPKQLCMQCLEKLNICHEFAESCLQAEKKLYNMNKERNFKTFSVAEKEIADDSNKKIGIKPFHDSITDLNKTNDSCYSCPLCCDGNMANPKESKESEIIGEIHKMDGIINTYHNSEENPYDNLSSHKTNPEDLFGLPTDTLYRKSNYLTCRMCDGTFESLESCLEHTKSHGLEGVLPCSLCDLAFHSEMSLNSHWKAHERERVTCATCRRLVSRANVETHSCRGSRPYKCPASDCGKFFRSEKRLQFHVRVHDGANPMSCDICHKMFSRETNLFEHVRMVHNRERPFACVTCGKAFQLKGRLIAHSRVHTGERPFKCDLCEGRFYNKETLKGREFIECKRVARV